MSTRESREEPGIDGLHRVRGPQWSASDLGTAISEMGASVRQRDLDALIRILCRIVPEYQPSAVLLELCSTTQRSRSPS